VRVTAGLVEIYGFMSKLPAGWLSRNWDQLHGRSFHVLAPETGKVCLPTIERWSDGIARQWEAKDCKLRIIQHGPKLW